MFINAVIAQFLVSLSIRKNLETISTILSQTLPGDLVLLPEGSVSGYSTDPAYLSAINQQELKDSLESLQIMAKERSIHLWAGAYIYENGVWFNTAVGFTPEGNRHVYKKINLASHERGVISAGSELPVFQLAFPAGEITLGVQICREVRYPEQWGWLARQGAQVLLHLNNAVGYDQFLPVWKSQLISRAAETQRFVLSSNNAAQKQTSPTIAITPAGEVLGEIISERCESTRVVLDLSQVSNWNLDQSRTDVIRFQYRQ